MISKKFFPFFLYSLLFPLVSDAALSHRSQLEAALGDLSYSMSRVMKVGEQQSAPSSHRKYITTVQGEVAGVLEFDQKKNTLSLFMKDTCNSQWGNVLKREPSEEKVSLFQGKVSAHVRQGIFEIYRNLFWTQGEEGTHLLSRFIEGLIGQDALKDLKALKIKMRGSSLGGSLVQLAAGDCKACLFARGIKDPHIEIMTWGAPLILLEGEAPLYDEYMQGDHFLHLTFQGTQDPVVRSFDETLQKVVRLPLVETILPMVGNNPLMAALGVSCLLPGFNLANLPHLDLAGVCATIKKLRTLSSSSKWASLGTSIDIASVRDESFAPFLADPSNIGPFLSSVINSHVLEEFYMGADQEGDASRTYKALEQYIEALS